MQQAHVFVFCTQILQTAKVGLVGLLVAPHLTLMSEALFSIPPTWLMCVHIYNQLAKTHAAD